MIGCNFRLFRVLRIGWRKPTVASWNLIIGHVLKVPQSERYDLFAVITFFVYSYDFWFLHFEMFLKITGPSHDGSNLSVGVSRPKA